MSVLDIHKDNKFTFTDRRTKADKHAFPPSQQLSLPGKHPLVAVPDGARLMDLMEQIHALAHEADDRFARNRSSPPRPSFSARSSSAEMSMSSRPATGRPGGEEAEHSVHRIVWRRAPVEPEPLLRRAAGFVVVGGEGSTGNDAEHIRCPVL